MRPGWAHFPDVFPEMGWCSWHSKQGIDHPCSPPQRSESSELMNLQPWNLVFFACFVLYAGIRGFYEKRTRRNENALSRVDTRDRLLLAVVLTGAAATGLLLLLGLDLLGRATAERAGDQKGQQAGEDGSEARHRW